MKKFTFGNPEKLVPSKYCDGFNYIETEVKYPETNFKFKKTKSGCVLEFPIEDDCRIFGFGLQLKRFEHKYQKLKLAVNADPVMPIGESHAPVPFFVTNKGYGMFFDTARYAEFYCGKMKNNGINKESKSGGGTSTDELYAKREESDVIMTVSIPVAEGIDVYVIEGETITDIVSQYNMLSGGGCDVPEWGLGVMYRCFTGWGEDGIKKTADYFRENNIPCDIIGLEPGWQTGAYPCTYKPSDKFPNFADMVKYLTDRNFHVNLWEHAFTSTKSEIHDDLIPYSGDYLVWGGLVPDFATEEAKKIFADYHREKITSLGIDGFKLDECDSSDNTGSWSFPLCAEFPSGLDGEQYHSLFGMLYAKTIMQALDNEPTLSQVRQMGALAASYPFVLYSDLYDHKDFIRGVTTAPFSGLLWSPEFRDAKTKDECLRRLQAVVFSVQCLVNAWYYDGIPWVGFDCEDEVRELFNTRKKLVPMLKKAFEEYKSTGKPPVRALVMDYTDDAETYNIDDEWLFCDDLLVAPIPANTGDERKVYLPTNSKWVDYFTGEPVESGWSEVSTKGIPVYKHI
ncbi:MAG: glycoside hydrolase [Clostridia bacterium]|nr:glycoside hydrolase [Clostridia bacterium]